MIIKCVKLLLLPFIFISCSQNDEITKLNKEIQQIKTELDSMKIQKEKWQDYDIKGKWDLSQEMIDHYEKNSPNLNYIKRIDFYEKPYLIFADFTQKVPIRYVVDYNKITIYDNEEISIVGKPKNERVYLTFDLVSKDTLICLSANDRVDYRGLYIKRK